jgi:hypothetical protein
VHRFLEELKSIFVFWLEIEYNLSVLFHFSTAVSLLPLLSPFPAPHRFRRIFR